MISVDSDVVAVFTQADGNLILEFAAKLNLTYEAMLGPKEALDVDAAAAEP